MELWRKEETTALKTSINLLIGMCISGKKYYSILTEKYLNNIKKSVNQGPPHARTHAHTHLRYTHTQKKSTFLDRGHYMLSNGELSKKISPPEVVKAHGIKPLQYLNVMKCVSMETLFVSLGNSLSLNR